MKLITRDTDYGLRALCYIAKRGKRLVSVSELVADLAIPRPFLRKILQILNKAGILRSYKGRGGGFILAQEPQKIYLLKLIKIFQGPLVINQCLFKKVPCPNKKKCKLRAKIERIQKFAITEFKPVTLESLIKEK